VPTLSSIMSRYFRAAFIGTSTPAQEHTYANHPTGAQTASAGPSSQPLRIARPFSKSPNRRVTHSPSASSTITHTDTIIYSSSTPRTTAARGYASTSGSILDGTDSGIATTGSAGSSKSQGGTGSGLFDDIVEEQKKEEKAKATAERIAKVFKEVCHRPITQIHCLPHTTCPYIPPIRRTPPPL